MTTPTLRENPLLDKITSEARERFDKDKPCINIGCDNNGCIANRVADDEWEQQQCQFCHEVRFPEFARIVQELTQADSLIREDEGRRVVGEMKVTVQNLTGSSKAVTEREDGRDEGWNGALGSVLGELDSLLFHLTQKEEVK